MDDFDTGSRSDLRHSQSTRDETETHDLVAADYPCLGCEYNLRALKLDGVCPECGLRVDLTVRAFHGDVRIPLGLRFVGFLSILAGVFTLVSLLPNLLNHRFEMPVLALGIPAGFGLWRLSKRWRVTAIVLLVFCLSAGVLGIAFALRLPGLVSLQLLGQPVAFIHKTTAVVSLVAFTLANLCLMRVLFAPRLRRMFRVLGPHMKSIRPGAAERYRRIMFVIASCCIAVSILLTAAMLAFAEDIDRWLLQRANATQEETTRQAVVQSGPIQAQIKLVLSWDGSFSSSGSYFTSTTRYDSLTGKSTQTALSSTLTGLKRIGSRDYMNRIVSGRGKDVDDVEHRVLDFLFWVDSDSGKGDVQLTCRVPTEIGFDESRRVTFADLNTHESLASPVLLRPGTYHFDVTATRPE